MINNINILNKLIKDIKQGKVNIISFGDFFNVLNINI